MSRAVSNYFALIDSMGQIIIEFGDPNFSSFKKLDCLIVPGDTNRQLVIKRGFLDRRLAIAYIHHPDFKDKHRKIAELKRKNTPLYSPLLVCGISSRDSQIKFKGIPREVLDDFLKHDIYVFDYDEF